MLEMVKYLFSRSKEALAPPLRQETTAAAEVKKAKGPILLIRGEDDRFVPCEMSKEIAAASPLVERHTFPGAGHGLSYMTDRERYLTLVDDILRRTAEGQTNDS